MLMDNKGVSGGAPDKSSAFLGVKEKITNEKRDEFAEFADSREDLKPKIEMPAELIDNDNSAEVDGEMQAQGQPTVTPPPAQIDSVDEDERKDQEVKAQLEQIKVARDAESLPKDYEKAVRDIISRNRKDPFRLVKEMDIARWDLLNKAFDRKLGDGLSGRGA